MKKNNFSILQIKKYLNKKGFIITKKNETKKNEIGLGSLSRAFLSSLIIISIFFVAPMVIKFSKEKVIFSKNYEDNSKNSLKKLRENQDIELDDDIDKKFLFDDIFNYSISI